MRNCLTGSFSTYSISTCSISTSSMHPVCRARLYSLQQHACKMSYAYTAASQTVFMISVRCKLSYTHLAPGQVKNGIVVRQPLCRGAIFIMQASRQGCSSVKNGDIPFLICHRKVLAVVQYLHCMYTVMYIVVCTSKDSKLCDLQVLQMHLPFAISSRVCVSMLCAVKPGSNSQCGSRNRHTNLTILYGKWRRTNSMRMHQNCAC